MLQDRSPFDSPPPPPNNSRLGGNRYQFRRKILKLVGASFYVYEPSGQIVLFADRKGFRWKEDIRIYTGEDKTVEVIRISARSILDFSSAFDVYDSPTNTKLGALKRKGLKSTFVRDEWLILDAADREIGLIQEDSAALALLRRFVEYAALLLPQKYTMKIGNREVGTMAHVFNPFSSKIDVDFSADPNGILDRRIAMASGVLMCAIEGHQR